VDRARYHIAQHFILATEEEHRLCLSPGPHVWFRRKPEARAGGRVKVSANLRSSVANAVWGVLAREPLQPVFRALHWLSLRGMNFGGGSTARASGELQAAALLAHLRRPEQRLVIFDVGANAGQYAVAMAQMLEGPLDVFSFEPSRATFESLVGAVSAYPSIKPYQLGMGARRETVVLYSNEPGSGIASVFQRRLEHFGVHMTLEERVELSTVDEFCQEHGVAHIDLLKLDIEGNELGALEGARGMIARGAIDLIQFEFGGCNVDSRTYFQDFFFLLDPTYRIHRVLRHGLARVDTYGELHEVFTTTNYLAMRRAATFTR
jgi:FkbM family methyltransferase